MRWNDPVNAQPFFFYIWHLVIRTSARVNYPPSEIGAGQLRNSRYFLKCHNEPAT